MRSQVTSELKSRAPSSSNGAPLQVKTVFPSSAAPFSSTIEILGGTDKTRGDGIFYCFATAEIVSFQKETLREFSTPQERKREDLLLTM